MVVVTSPCLSSGIEALSKVGMVYRSKLDWIERFVRSETGDGKTVLDLGCVCHNLDQTAVPWLHGFLVRCAGRVLGVDYLPDEIQRMRREGYDVVCANVEEMDLQETFDVIVAGDIIEHLGDVSRFIERVRAHLKPDGVFLVTTPNPITWVRFLRILLKSHAGSNREHTCWFTGKVLRQLAGGGGLEVVEEAFVDDTRLFYPWFKRQKRCSPARRVLRNVGRFLSMLLIWRPALLAQSILCRFRPRLSETVCMAFRVADKKT